MVARLKPPAIARGLALTAALLAIATVAPRLAFFAALLASIMVVARLDDRAGTWGVLYVVLLIILAVLALLVAGLGLIHRLISG